VDMGAITNEDMKEGEADPQLVLVVDKSFMYQCFVPNRACFVHTVIVSSMSSKTVLTY
jgi:hypothetical protein